MQKGRSHEALKHALNSAFSGFFSYEDAGYLGAASLVPTLPISKTEKQRFLDRLSTYCQLKHADVIAGECAEIGGDILVKDITLQELEALLISTADSAGAESSLASGYARHHIKTGDYKALLIANEVYDSLPSLSTPAEDVRALGEVLETDFNFSIDYLFNATREQILSRISALRKELSPKDNLLIYYAGYGTYDRELGMGFWQPIDAEPTQDFTWIDTDRLSKRLSTFSARNILVVADSCFSGAVLEEPTLSLVMLQKMLGLSRA